MSCATHVGALLKSHNGVVYLEVQTCCVELHFHVVVVKCLSFPWGPLQCVQASGLCHVEADPFFRTNVRQELVWQREGVDSADIDYIVHNGILIIRLEPLILDSGLELGKHINHSLHGRFKVVHFAGSKVQQHLGADCTRRVNDLGIARIAALHLRRVRHPKKARLAEVVEDVLQRLEVSCINVLKEGP